ncbi:GNAT family N-acetyltransferase [Sedimentibacter sp. zth1]|uniref:GNAT family N-acetyltransferase n=1 Tax=Sedimentibacter sp. zth1 TaxID=2816908 RepID=UPI001A914D8F|nr:GNAT family N-acetyltransferase [Sedimentibacter sp. zth1]QSX07000.1 GNAT family N-acetyltransferase [Sedimentibacter sp. zth1]
MIYKVEKNLRKKIIPMFEDMDDTMILSCLQGHMGEVYVDNLDNPTVAQIIVGLFIFYAGNVKLDVVDELLCNLPQDSLVIVETEEWKNKIEEIHKGRYEKFDRYSFKQDAKYLDYNHIKSFISKLPVDYELKKIDEKITKSDFFINHTKDFTEQYESVEDFLNRGFGYCIMHGEKVICCATSYSIYDGGIEIEIDTDPEYRKKGLATIASAALIIDCLDRGIYPSWDAANLNSVGLAKKLGYVMDKPYDTYYIEYNK